MSMTKLIKGALWTLCLVAAIAVAIFGYYQISSASPDVDSNLNNPQDATETPAPTPIPVEMSDEYQKLLAQVQELQQQLDQSPQTETSSTEVPTVPTVPTLIIPSLELEETEVVSEDVHSSDLVLTGITEEGWSVTYAICEADLDRVDFEDVVVDTWDGVMIVRNTSGVICEVFGHENEGSARSAKMSVSDETVQGFFLNGLLKGENARWGWNEDGNGLVLVNLVDVRIIKIEKEGFCRLVIAGGKTSGSSSNWSSSTPEPTEEPTQAPTATPRIPDTDIDQGLEDWVNGTEKPQEPIPMATPRIGSDASGVTENDASQDSESWRQEGQEENNDNDDVVATPSIGGNSATATPSIGSTTSSTTSVDLEAWVAGENTTSGIGEDFEGGMDD